MNHTRLRIMKCLMKLKQGKRRQFQPAKPAKKLLVSSATQPQILDDKHRK